ncbi:MAG: serine/threonine-protein kinase, partial [Terracidiphilus sp.]
MTDSTRSDKNPVPKKPGSPGVGTPFVGESSSSGIPASPQKQPAHDSEATIIDNISRTASQSELVDADVTIFDAPVQRDPNATTIDPQATILDAVPSGRFPNAQSGAGELKIGDLLGGRYELLKLLGEGGMGAVYKARDAELERDVALKVIKPELAEHPEILQRFKQELILARQVTDRNVIRIFDIGEAGKIKFITMEYLEGENLHQLLKQRGKLEVGEAVDIMEQVASGLAAAHRE